MKLHLLLTTGALAVLAACGGPSTDGAKPEAPATSDIAAPTPDSGPAAPNTTDTLSSTPAETPPPAAVPPAVVPPTTPPAPTPVSATPTAQPTGPTKAELAAGAGVYTRTCAMCHGPTGGGTAMGVPLAAAKDIAKIKEKVTKGVVATGDKMPPMGAALSAEDLDAVAKYVAAGMPAQ